MLASIGKVRALEYKLSVDKSHRRKCMQSRQI